MSLQPTVSVIMASHNCAPWLKAAVQSVVNQTFDDWELLIVDDASTDGTSALLPQLQALDTRISVSRLNSNGGAARARNSALAMAGGRFIAFLDSDDMWAPNKLERQIAFMLEHDVAFSFTSYSRIDVAGRVLSTVPVPPATTYRAMLGGNVIGCLTAVYDTTVFGRVEMPDLAKRQDYALWLKLLKQVNSAVSLSENLAYYRVRASSVSSNKFVAARYTWRVLRDVENLSFLSASYYFACYAIRGIWSHYGPRK